MGLCPRGGLSRRYVWPVRLRRRWIQL